MEKRHVLSVYLRLSFFGLFVSKTGLFGQRLKSKAYRDTSEGQIRSR